MEYDFTFLSDYKPQAICDGALRQSAVCIPLVESGDGIRVLFERRSENMNSQPGDVCFPGGGIKEGETPAEAAVRELTEELKVRPEQFELLGAADYISADASRVYPFVGWLRGYDGSFSKAEVAEVFTVPLDFFCKTEPEVHVVEWRADFPKDFPFEKIYGGREYNWRVLKNRVFFYEYEGRVIWGMTAKIMRAFAALYKRYMIL